MENPGQKENIKSSFAKCDDSSQFRPIKSYSHKNTFFRSHPEMLGAKKAEPKKVKRGEQAGEEDTEL